MKRIRSLPLITFLRLPEGKNQELGVKNIIGNWAKKDPLAAGTWLNEQPAGPRLGFGIGELCINRFP